MPAADFDYFDPARNPGIAGTVNENVFEASIAPVHAALRCDGGHTVPTGELDLAGAPR